MSKTMPARPAPTDALGNLRLYCPAAGRDCVCPPGERCADYSTTPARMHDEDGGQDR
jgi:hypothetical protein